MIKHRWHDTLVRDRALHPGEWAGVRPSDREERKVIGVGMHDACNTFLFQGCGHILRLIITSTVRQPSFLKRLRMDELIRRKTTEMPLDVLQPFSSLVLAAAMTLSPSIIVDLHRVQLSMRCPGCMCVFRSGGPVDPNSAQALFARNQVLETFHITGEART